MSHRVLASRLFPLAAAVAAALILLLARVPAPGQTPDPAKKAATAKARAWTPSRTADGHPDLEGIWTNATITPLERPKRLGAKEFYTDGEFAELSKRASEGILGDEADIGAANPQQLRYDLSLYGFDIKKVKFASTKRTSLIVGPEGTVPPMLAEARKRNADRAAKNRGHEFDSYENRPLQERCIVMGQERIPMLPAVNDSNLLQIAQGPGYVGMLHEINHSTRFIPTDGRAHLPENIRQWQGDSVGRWEGDTLVIDTTNFTDLTPFRGSGEKLHLVERFTRISDDTIIYRFTAEDPTTWDKPWTAEVPWTKTEGPVYEWGCHEGNTMISNILKGARVQEADSK